MCARIGDDIALDAEARIASRQVRAVLEADGSGSEGEEEPGGGSGGLGVGAGRAAGAGSSVSAEEQIEAARAAAMESSPDAALEALRADCVPDDVALCCRLVLECLWRRRAFLEGEVRASGQPGGGVRAWEQRVRDRWESAECRGELLGTLPEGVVQSVVDSMVRSGELRASVSLESQRGESGARGSADRPGLSPVLIAPRAPALVQQAAMQGASTVGGWLADRSDWDEGSVWGRTSRAGSSPRPRSRMRSMSGGSQVLEGRQGQGHGQGQGQGQAPGSPASPLRLPKSRRSSVASGDPENLESPVRSGGGQDRLRSALEAGLQAPRPLAAGEAPTVLLRLHRGECVRSAEEQHAACPLLLRGVLGSVSLSGGDVTSLLVRSGLVWGRLAASVLRGAVKDGSGGAGKDGEGEGESKSSTVRG